MGHGRYFTNLDCKDFMHPTDAKALKALEMAKGLPALVNWMTKVYDEKLMRILSMGCDVRVTKKTFRQVYEMTEHAAHVLGMPMPDVFINQSPEANAFAIGTDAPMIQVYSGLIELMNEDELRAVIAHEMGHIKCGHVLYKTIAGLITNGTLFPMGPLRGVFNFAVAMTLLEWDRKSEFSADRASLLVVQDAKPVISMLMKLAGGSQKVADQMDVDDFIEQSRQFGVISDGLMGKFIKLKFKSYLTHPFPVMRAAEIDSWSRSTEYEGIIGRGKPEPQHPEAETRPARLSAESGLKRAVRLKWIAPPFHNTSGYKVYRSENPAHGFTYKEVTGRDQTEFVDKSLEDGRTFYYFVKGRDLYGNESEPTPVVSATTKAHPEPVEDLFPEGDLVRKATVRWIVSPGRDPSMKIHVYRSDRTIDRFKKIATVPLYEGVYHDTGLADHCTYHYQVVVDDEGICSKTSGIVSICTKKQLNAPSDVRAEYDRGMISLQWSVVPEALHYEVYDDGSLFDSKLGKFSHPYFRKSISLKPGKTAAFYVKAVDRHGRKSEKSKKAVVEA